jgi:alkylation response protein AidB-like acyl-CoA dehydrogenase
VGQDGVVTTADGFKEAYATFCETGWNGMPASTEFGGQGLPVTVSTAVLEMWKSASISFSLCQMLTLGAVEAIAHHGSDELKATYLPNMVSGKWTGTMNLTEPQAGSDLAAIRSKAEPRGDGTYAITGTKIFITWGEHDMAENIVHLVLARLPDAPPGVKGISLFIAPKFLVNADGSLGERNDLICASIEHKMGIHGSATAVMSFGDKGGAIGYLVGEPNRGLEYMFTMMNHARLNVGLEGVGVSERSYQHALAYARERIQGKIIGDKSGEKKPILHHPDVRRMLMDMKSRTEAGRAIAYYVAGCMDRAKSSPTPTCAAANQSRLELLTPVVKGWCTENAQGITWNGVQVHGGMGFIEETGAAQYMRDARIITIYEGTTAIQANDLIGRKTAKEGGKSMQQLLADIAETRAALRRLRQPGAQGDGRQPRRRHRRPRRSHQLAARQLRRQPAGRRGRLGALPQAHRHRRRRLADGPLRPGCRRAAWRPPMATSTRPRWPPPATSPSTSSPKPTAYRDAIVGGAESVLALEEALF